MACAGIFTQTVISLADIICLVYRLTFFPCPAVFVPPAHLFITYLHRLPTGGTIDNAMKNIIIWAVIPLHDWWSAVYKLLNLFPLRFRYNGFMTVLYNFSLLPRNDVVSVGTYPLLMRFADNVCALVKWITQDSGNT